MATTTESVPVKGEEDANDGLPVLNDQVAKLQAAELDAAKLEVGQPTRES